MPSLGIAWKTPGGRSVPTVPSSLIGGVARGDI